MDIGEINAEIPTTDGSMYVYDSNRKKNGDLVVAIYYEPISWRRRLAIFFPNIKRYVQEYSYIVDARGVVNQSSWRIKEAKFEGGRIAYKQKVHTLSSISEDKRDFMINQTKNLTDKILAYGLPN